MTRDPAPGFKVLITCPQMQKSVDRYRDRFERAGVRIDLPELIQKLSEDELIAIIGDYDGMIAGDDPVSARVLNHARRMKIISKWGVGIDNVDVQAATSLGIKVTNTPGMFGNEVADVTVGYIIMLARQLHRTNELVRNGQWPKLQGTSLSGKVLGIVGLGSIGYAVAKRALAMEMVVHGHEIMDSAVARAGAIGVIVSDLDSLLERTDFLALCCPLTRENHHLINARALDRMKHGSFLINTARGGLVDESAVVDALERGRLAGAAFDVFEVEPLPDQSRLRAFEQVILGAHNSSNTLEGTLRVNDIALQHLFDGLFSSSAIATTGSPGV